MIRSLTPRRPGRSGFTAIELLVVVAIIAILAGLLLSALGLLRKMGLKAKTTNNMSQLTHSISSYLDTYSRLGSLADSFETDPQHSLAFRKDPFYFIYVTPRNMGGEPFFNPPLLSLVTATAANACSPATSPMTATHMCDAYGTSPSNVYSWLIINGTPLGGGVSFSFTQTIDLRSSAGTPDDPTDDIDFHFDSGTQRWDLVKTTVPWNSAANFNEALPAGSQQHPPP
jgi:prepilin-type N-terminal cleavage/methylation domain-containing protein